MKRLTLVVVSLTILAGCGPAAPEVPIEVTPSIQIDAHTKINDAFHIYEFTPKTAPNKQCIVAYRGGLVCFDKEIVK